MDASQFLSDTLSAVTAAAMVAGFAWTYSFFRNLQLERSLKNAVNPNGVGMGLSLNPLSASFTLQVHNYSTATVRVRTIVLIAEKFHIELQPDSERELSQVPLSNEVLRPKFRRTFLSSGAIEEDNNPHSQVLPPKTMGQWRVWPTTIGQHEWKLTHGFVVFEYPTIFGNAAMIRVRIPDVHFKLIKNCFEELNVCYRLRRPLPDPRDRVRA